MTFVPFSGRNSTAVIPSVRGDRTIRSRGILRNGAPWSIAQPSRCSGQGKPARNAAPSCSDWPSGWRANPINISRRISCCATFGREASSHPRRFEVRSGTSRFPQPLHPPAVAYAERQGYRPADLTSGRRIASGTFGFARMGRLDKLSGSMSPEKTVSKLRSSPGPYLAQAPAPKLGVGVDLNRCRDHVDCLFGPDTVLTRFRPHADRRSTSVRCAGDFSPKVRSADTMEIAMRKNRPRTLSSSRVTLCLR